MTKFYNIIILNLFLRIWPGFSLIFEFFFVPTCFDVYRQCKYQIFLLLIFIFMFKLNEKTTIHEY